MKCNAPFKSGLNINKKSKMGFLQRKYTSMANAVVLTLQT